MKNEQKGQSVALGEVRRGNMTILRSIALIGALIGGFWTGGQLVGPEANQSLLYGLCIAAVVVIFVMAVLLACREMIFKVLPAAKNKKDDGQKEQARWWLPGSGWWDKVIVETPGIYQLDGDINRREDIIALLLMGGLGLLVLALWIVRVINDKFPLEGLFELFIGLALTMGGWIFALTTFFAIVHKIQGD